MNIPQLLSQINTPDKMIIACIVFVLLLGAIGSIVDWLGGDK